jgi:hypothetical protein
MDRAAAHHLNANAAELHAILASNVFDAIGSADRFP